MLRPVLGKLGQLRLVLLVRGVGDVEVVGDFPVHGFNVTLLRFLHRLSLGLN